MGQLIDLTNQRFGKLAVREMGACHIQPSGQRKITWKCLCDCGNWVTVLATSLRRGYTKSCGHCNDIRDGDKFHYLKVLCGTIPRINPNTGEKNFQVICLCKCGNYTVISETHLKSGHTKSCGCYHKEKIRERCFKDLTGQTFGDWIEIIYDKEASKLKGRSYYKCTCKCGSIKFVAGNILVYGGSKSCGACKRIVLGKMYGYLEPLEQVEDHITPSGKHYSQYKCKCHYNGEECKGYAVVGSSNLQTGITKSCGCLQKEWASVINTGSNSGCWKGDDCVSPLKKRIYESARYKAWRKKIFERDNYICQKCGREGKKDLRAHHKKGFSRIWNENNITTYEQALVCEELWDVENGITLIEEWHKGEITYNPKAFHRLYGKHDFTRQDFEEWLKE